MQAHLFMDLGHISAHVKRGLKNLSRARYPKQYRLHKKALITASEVKAFLSRNKALDSVHYKHDTYDGPMRHCLDGFAPTERDRGIQDSFEL